MWPFRLAPEPKDAGFRHSGSRPAAEFNQAYVMCAHHQAPASPRAHHITLMIQRAPKFGLSALRIVVGLISIKPLFEAED